MSSEMDKINYRDILKKLEKNSTEPEVLDYVINNMDKIVKESDFYFPNVMEEISYLMYFASSKQVKQLDGKLVQNMDNILQIRIDKGGYNISDFNEFPNFIEEIRKRGPEFFINFPITNSRKEYQKIAEDIFGKYDEENFAIFEFGRYDKSKAEMTKYILKELINASSKGTSAKNIKKIGEGSYSKAYKVGDYILKVGKSRVVPEIPNHRRILQPIIRKKIITDRNSYDDVSVCDFYEVQNYVDTSALESMYPDQRENILYEIYSELRDDGLVWLDPSYKNIGRLLKPNKANLPFINPKGEQEDIRPTQEATGVIRRK